MSKIQPKFLPGDVIYIPITKVWGRQIAIGLIIGCKQYKDKDASSQFFDYCILWNDSSMNLFGPSLDFSVFKKLS